MSRLCSASNVDAITIRELAVWTRIGTTVAEREMEQKLIVTLEMRLGLSNAGHSDEIEDTVNYDDVARDIRELAKAERRLVERFCEDIAALVLKKYSPLSVRVSIAKFAIPESHGVLVSIERPKT